MLGTKLGLCVWNTVSEKERGTARGWGGEQNKTALGLAGQGEALFYSKDD